MPARDIISDSNSNEKSERMSQRHHHQRGGALRRAAVQFPCTTRLSNTPSFSLLSGVRITEGEDGAFADEDENGGRDELRQGSADGVWMDRVLRSPHGKSSRRHLFFFFFFFFSLRE